MKKLFVFLLLFFGLIAKPVLADDYEIAAKSAIAVDANSGKILYEKEATSPLEVGAITNILTVYLVYEAIADGKLSLETEVDISDYAYQLTVNPSIANLPLEARRYKVKDLLNASLLASANSATIALAEKVGGSEENFVKMMKAKLKEWNISDATIVNATGTDIRLLDGSLETTNTEEESAENSKSKKKQETANKFSAYDIAVIASHLIDDYPEVLGITSKSHVNFAGIQLENPNLMLEGSPSFRTGVKGLKTGGSEQNGVSFVGVTNEKGMRLITVVLGVAQENNDPNTRFGVTSSLMTYVTQNFSPTVLVKKGERYNNSQVAIRDSQEDKVAAVASEDLVILERIANQAEHKVTFTPSPQELQAPLKKGSVVGTLTYTDSEPIGQGYIENKKTSISMVTEKKVEKAIIFKVWWNDFIRFVNEKL